MRNKFVLVFDNSNISSPTTNQRSTRRETRHAAVYYNLTERKMLLKKMRRTEVRRYWPRNFSSLPWTAMQRGEPKSTTRNSRLICDPIYFPHSSDAQTRHEVSSKIMNGFIPRPRQCKHDCLSIRTEQTTFVPAWQGHCSRVEVDDGDNRYMPSIGCSGGGCIAGRGVGR